MNDDVIHSTNFILLNGQMVQDHLYFNTGLIRSAEGPVPRGDEIKGKRPPT